MLPILSWVDPVSPVLDAKQIGLTLVSVLLFIGSLGLQLAVNNKMQAFSSALDKIREVVDSTTNTLSVIKTKAEDTAEEAHEQWSKLNDVLQNVREGSMRVIDVKTHIESISHQQTVLATAQLNQQQQTQKIIDSLIEILQTRD